MCGMLTLRLYYRPEWVEKERREPKTWVAAEDCRWRSVEEEKPPGGVPVIAMVKGAKKKLDNEEV